MKRHGVRGRRIEDGAQRTFFQALVDLDKRLLVFVLMRVRLDDLEVAHHLIDESRLLGARLRLQLEHGIGVRGDEFRREQGNGRDAEDDERDLKAEHEHDDERAEDGTDARKQLRKPEQKSVRKLLRIRDDDAGDLPVRARIDVTQRQYLDFAECVAADIRQNVIGDLVVAQAHQPLRERRHGDAAADDEEEVAETGEIDLPRPEDAVDGKADEKRDRERQKDGDEREEDGAEEVPRVRPEIAENAFERLCPFHRVHASSSLNCER